MHLAALDRLFVVINFMAVIQCVQRLRFHLGFLVLNLTAHKNLVGKHCWQNEMSKNVVHFTG